MLRVAPGHILLESICMFVYKVWEFMLQECIHLSSLQPLGGTSLASPGRLSPLGFTEQLLE